MRRRIRVKRRERDVEQRRVMKTTRVSRSRKSVRVEAETLCHEDARRTGNFQRRQKYVNPARAARILRE